VSRIASNLGGGLGGAIGGLVAGIGLHGFVILFLANAATYLLYAGLLVAFAGRGVQPERAQAGYGDVLRDHAFVRLAAINVAVIGIGWGIFTWIVPAFAREQAGASTQLLGLMLLVNSLAVVVLQLPVARLAEGRRRTRTMATATAAFTTACALVVFAGCAGQTAPAFLLFAAAAVGVGECFHTTVLMPLVADLAPDSLRGRYMGAAGLSWWLGLALAPALGGVALGVSPGDTIAIAGAVAAGAGIAVLRLERRLPVAVRLTPRPNQEPAVRAAAEG
jgi:MFS family permease